MPILSKRIRTESKLSPKNVSKWRGVCGQKIQQKTVGKRNKKKILQNVHCARIVLEEM